MENNQQDEIDKLKRLLIELEDKNNKMYYELRELNLKINQIVQNQTSNPVNEKKVEEIIPAEEEKPPVEIKEETINPSPEAEIIPEPELIQVTTPTQPVIEVIPEVVVQQNIPLQNTQARPTQQAAPKKPSKSKQDWERFIGENLINKIGILITIIGVAIGTKYAIDKEILTIPMRIALGYAVGAGLLLFALKLKAKYLDFSAVLLSGSMAIFYFLTYISFSFYHFFPIQLTFGLMFLFTAFTVFSAIKYDRQVIAHVGLVGAYAVPFLLSDGSGKVGFFYSYIAIINVGILIISFIRNWKPLQYVAYGLTWVIFFSWYFFSYNAKVHFNLALLFVFVFFLIFYVTGLAYKVLKHEKFNVNDVFFILGNSFIFFGLGYNIINGQKEFQDYLGLFCVFNAILHFIVSVVLYRNKLVDKTIFYLSTAMVLLFITITIPVQFDGDVITITWTSEALMLFLLGRIKKISMFELMSYPIFIVAFVSLGFFWIQNYGQASSHNSFFSFHYKYSQEEMLKISESLKSSFLFNMKFFSTLLFALAIGAVYYFNNVRAKIESITISTAKSFNVLAVILLLVSLFVGIFLEINQFWEMKELGYKLGLVKTERHFDGFDFKILHTFAHISKISYCLIFFGLLLFLRGKKQNSSEFSYLLFSISCLIIVVFLSYGVYQMRDLKFMHLNAEETNFPAYSFVLLRLGLYAIFAGFIYAFVRFIKKQIPSLFITNFASFLVLFIIFLCTFMEIKLFWEVKELAFKMLGRKEGQLVDLSTLKMIHAFGVLSKIAFGIIFFGIITYFNAKKEKTAAFKYIIFSASIIAILFFITLGTFNFRYLETYHLYTKNEYYSGFTIVFVRYLMYALLGGFIYSFVRFLKAQMKTSVIENFILFMVHLVIFLCVFMEINLYWEIKEIAFKIMCRTELHRLDEYNLSLLQSFALISKIAFVTIFFGVVLFLRTKKETNLEFKTFVFAASTISILLFLSVGLYNFSFLQLNYLHSKNEYFAPFTLVLVRYLMYGIFTVYMFNYIQFIKKQFNTKFFLSFAEFMMHISLLWVVSSELVDWMHVFNSKQVYKLALSILWGIYSLGLISYGIWKKKSHLRIGAISLFGVTLIKLFVYDLQHMSTISKTVVFLALGILLLIISFLYNKYKSILFEENEK